MTIKKTVVRRTQTGFIGAQEQYTEELVEVENSTWMIFVDGELVQVNRGRPPENQAVNLLKFAVTRKLQSLGETFTPDILREYVPNELPVVFYAFEGEVLDFGLSAKINLPVDMVANRLECALSRMSGRSVIVEIVGKQS